MATLEEENFLRLSLVLAGIAPRAVRTLFDKEFHPNMFTTTLRAMYKRLRDLSNNKHITQPQWKLLFPGTNGSNPDSRNFDVSLMICLLRNLTNITNPRGGFDNLPQKSDHSEGADLARIKYYRNYYFAHMNDSKIDNKFFERAWTDISTAIERLGGSRLKSECEHYRTAPLDQQNIELIKEIQQAKMELESAKMDIEDLQDEIREIKEDFNTFENNTKRMRTNQQTPLILEWEYQEKMKCFVATDTTRAVAQAITNNQCVIITGPPGCGKLMNTMHAALQGHDKRLKISKQIDDFFFQHFRLADQYTMYTENDADQYTENESCVYILNNVFGETAFDVKSFLSWKESLGIVKLLLRRNTCKIVITCRQHIYDQNIKEQIGISVFNYPLKYNNEEIHQICQSYMNPKCELTLPEDHLVLATLPAIFSSKMNHCFYKTVQNPETTMNEFIRYVFDQMESVWHSLAFVLLCLLNNFVDEQMFRLSNHSLDNLLKEMCFEHANRVPDIKAHMENALTSLQGSYVTKTNGRYEFMYKWFFNYVADYVWEKYNDLCIKYGSSAFFTDKLLMQESKQNTDNPLGQMTTEHIYRLVRDLKAGNIWNVFRTMCRFSEINDSLIEELTNQDLSGYKDLKDKSTCLHAACCFGNTNLVDILLKMDSSEINAENSDKKTPLYYAAAMGYSQIVLILLKNDAVLTRSYDNYCPLFIACANEHVEIVRILLDSTTVKNRPHLPNDSLIRIACANGNNEIVDLLLNWKSVLSKSRDMPSQRLMESKIYGITPLHIASYDGHERITQLLISHSAPVNSQTNSGSTPLCMAAKEGHKNIVSILLEHSASVNMGGCSYIPPPLYLASAKGFAEIVDILLQYNPTIDFDSNTDDTALSIAVKHGHDAVIKVFLENNAYFARRINTDCLLHVACMVRSSYLKGPIKNNTSTIRLLLDHTTDVNKRNSTGSTALLYAIYNVNIEICELLISYGASVNHPDISGFTPLMAAAKVNSIKLVKLLLQKEANINEQTKTGDTALHILVCVEGHWSGNYKETEEMIEFLIYNGADINITNRDGYSPLDFACKFGFFHGVSLLHKHGAKLDKNDKTGKTPLYIACENEKLDVVKILLKHNANVNQQGVTDGSTALLGTLYKNLGRYFTNETQEFYETQKEIVKLLLENGAKVNLVDQDNKNIFHNVIETNNTLLLGLILKYNPDPYIATKSGSTVLHLACRNKNADMVSRLLKYILEYDANRKEKDYHENITTSNDRRLISIINACDHEGETALHIACRNGSRKIVDILLRKGADLNGLDKHNCTPLYLACETACRNAHQYFAYEVVRLLLQEGANVNMSCQQGCTALHLACEKGNHNLAKLLVQHEADVTMLDTCKRTAPDIIQQMNNTDLETWLNQCNTLDETIDHE